MGIFLRNNFTAGQRFGLTDVQVASCVVTYFMQIVGILQLPAFLGPNWNPFGLIALFSPWKDASAGATGKSGADDSKQIMLEEEETPPPASNGKSNKSKQKKKSKNKMKKA